MQQELQACYTKWDAVGTSKIARCCKNGPITPKCSPEWSVGLMGMMGHCSWNWKLNHSLHCAHSYGYTCLYIICPHICQHYYSWLLWHLGILMIFQWKKATFFFYYLVKELHLHVNRFAKAEGVHFQGSEYNFSITDCYRSLNWALHNSWQNSKRNI